VLVSLVASANDASLTNLVLGLDVLQIWGTDASTIESYKAEARKCGPRQMSLRRRAADLIAEVEQIQVKSLRISN